MQSAFAVLLSVAALSLSTGSVAAVFKCVEDGKTVYQGTPCPVRAPAGTPEPAKHSPDEGAAGNTDGASKAAGDIRSRSQSDPALRERRLSEIEYQLGQTEREVANYRRAMQDELAPLERRKRLASGSSAGAADVKSISADIAGVEEKYRARMQLSQDHAAALQKEADGLRK